MSLLDTITRSALALAVEQAESDRPTYRVVAHIPIPPGQLMSTKLLQHLEHTLRRTPTDEEVSMYEALLTWETFTWGEARLIGAAVETGAARFGAEADVRLEELEDGQD